MEHCMYSGRRELFFVDLWDLSHTVPVSHAHTHIERKIYEI